MRIILVYYYYLVCCHWLRLGTPYQSVHWGRSLTREQWSPPYTQCPTWWYPLSLWSTCSCDWFCPSTVLLAFLFVGLVCSLGLVWHWKTRQSQLQSEVCIVWIVVATTGKADGSLLNLIHKIRNLRYCQITNNKKHRSTRDLYTDIHMMQ